MSTFFFFLLNRPVGSDHHMFKLARPRRFTETLLRDMFEGSLPLLLLLNNERGTLFGSSFWLRVAQGSLQTPNVGHRLCLHVRIRSLMSSKSGLADTLPSVKLGLTQQKNRAAFFPLPSLHSLSLSATGEAFHGVDFVTMTRRPVCLMLCSQKGEKKEKKKLTSCSKSQPQTGMMAKGNGGSVTCFWLCFEEGCDNIIVRIDTTTTYVAGIFWLNVPGGKSKVREQGEKNHGQKNKDNDWRICPCFFL
ncbi:hypothetical protein QBC38DRAFT_217278 [Podospora fimiseda]|uniref:Uncharacterized protein n=1 Tax=Podospora fimiseda TaxID=252190 RepID=A0AAN7GTR2_9PEZI|nr:hypothetical protein QBC38DRAFT_217278 [Podospora fimiseda]